MVQFLEDQIVLQLHFYVYIYLNKSLQPYYVGKGCNGRAYKSHNNVEVPPKERIVFAVQNTSEEWAHFIEMRLIDHYGRLNDGTGTLENRTDGGEGVSGRIVSEKVKRKISENNGMKGRTHTEETKQKISDIQRNRPRKPHSEETKRKISEAKKGKPAHNKGKPGKPHSEETKQKIRKNHRGMKGKAHTKETKRKISNALKVFMSRLNLG